MPSAPDPHTAAYAALAAWWREAGVDAPPAPAPARRPNARSASSPARRAPAAPGPAKTPGHDDASAQRRADACRTLNDLRAALEAFTDHPLHAGAARTVFARGPEDAPIMIVGEAPGRDEDKAGLPFVGRSGQLLDRLMAAAGFDPARDVYVTNIVNWRPPGNRSPDAGDIALCLPFVRRHIALKAPKLLAPAGGVAAKALLEASAGITRLRGRWTRLPDAQDGPDVLPMLHPAFLLRHPIAKREAWADALALRERLDAMC